MFKRARQARAARALVRVESETARVMRATDAALREAWVAPVRDVRRDTW